MPEEKKDFQRSIKEISDKQLQFWYEEVKKDIAKNPNDITLQMKKTIIEFEKDRRNSMENESETE